MFPNFEVLALVFQDMLTEQARNRHLAEIAGRPNRFSRLIQQVRMLLFKRSDTHKPFARPEVEVAR
jgi:hypothetical protein